MESPRTSRGCWARTCRIDISFGRAGSVLGPILWNVGYDWILRVPVLPGVGLICFADDTLLTVRAASFAESVDVANAGLAIVVDRIARLGLRVSPAKTEAIMFQRKFRNPPADLTVSVQGVAIRVGPQMKYLGPYSNLSIDGKWLFKAHFEELVPKLVKSAGALSRLLPDVGGATRKLLWHPEEYGAVRCTRLVHCTSPPQQNPAAPGAAGSGREDHTGVSHSVAEGGHPPGRRSALASPGERPDSVLPGHTPGTLLRWIDWA
ncbi:hypothetical protein K1T71_010728 [Dendrolimus kikuchii]|uniref:Uncharacterized protein n=1 Tax=Dendrolimus kikuchii TaxID=765133 RepID=A0ACC1CPM6_9NEOP|nr:hypothetical protein K1T71_010728 [Dendrolimus kikuchii]